MTFSEETNQRIDQFAQEQSRRYLQQAEMTYQEKLRAKAEKAKERAGRRLSRFKANSPQAIEAKNDMTLYMNDYMEDLMSQGLSETEAFEKAKEELATSTHYDSQLDLQLQMNERYHERYLSYYENFNPAEEATIGLFYAVCTLSGLVVGGAVGFFGSGGRLEFLGGGWIDTLIGMGLGLMVGVCAGLLAHAVYRAIKNRNR